MINSIIQSISISLNAEFGDTYKNYTEEVKQGLKEPCFFISCVNPTHNLFLGKRYFRRNQFCIQYFPIDKERAKEECNAVAERMELCLEWITLEGKKTMGRNMYYEVADGILNFFVNYNMFVKKVNEYEVMEDLEEKTVLKG